mmetsp:Transcript_17204/g.60456  ORF Transcript_17204/g.60456 Transcript_17204/m.60456 type:complete len:286 (-) Transcript_17204:1094-1951(-)
MASDALMEELQVIQDRLQIINADVGGKSIPTKKPKKGDAFNWYKAKVVGGINDVNELCFERDNGETRSDKQRIKLKLKIDQALKALKDDMDDFEGLLADQAKKGKSKLTDEQIAARRVTVRDLRAQIDDVEELATGHAPAESGGAAYTRITINERGDLMSGGKPLEARPAARPAAALTGEQKLALEQIRREEGKQDDLLDQIGEGVDNLRTLAVGMREEAELQNVMLSDLETDVDKAQDHLNKVNDRMKETLEALNSKTDKFCTYVICLIILLGLLMVIYNQISK